MKFKDDFIFGGATAAYQCEGSTKEYGKGKVAWDDFLDKKGLFKGDPASDFYHQYPVDLKLCHDFHINGIRISIAWTRIFPDGDGKINQEGVDYYHRVFKECRKNGVEPFVTLHHFDTPNKYYQNGDFLNRDTVDAFVEYAKFCFEEYKDEVTYWFTFNEIWAVATNIYIEGQWPCGDKANMDKAFHCMHNMQVAHARAVVAYKEKGYKGKIGVVQSLESKYPYNENSELDIKAAKNEDVLENQFVLDATFNGEYSKETLEIVDKLVALNGGTFKASDEDIAVMKKAAKLNDYLGMNYYQSRFIQHYEGENLLNFNSTGEKGSSRFALKGVGERMDKEGIDKTDWDWLIYPEGMYDMIMRIKKQYPNYHKIYITENGMGYKDVFKDGNIDDTPRIDYIKRHLEWLLKSQEDGACIGGYFVWSLMDLFSWNNGYNKRYGLFYVDYKTQKRYPKKSAYWYKDVAIKKEL
ncbi:MAG: 6-phospho-beta-galactosidase [Thomasclavelia sp.]|jgi:6-phospho-beta-galactosidase|nr:6-phospho-beta-galactosidase [Thomasclavelia sp.]